jgi:methylated-DNA-[protein]-cysteine S-methyltransferase
MEELFFYAAYATVFGSGALCWRLSGAGIKIVRVFLPAKKGEADKMLWAAYPGAAHGEHPAIGQTMTKFKALTEGRKVSFSLLLLDWNSCPPFQQRVLRAEARVPAGRVTTYGRLAERIGAPGAARAVGHALALNPFPLIIPCHRAVRSDGALGGFQGGLAMKRKLLEREGVSFSPSGKALVDKYWFEAGCLTKSEPSTIS